MIWITALLCWAAHCQQVELAYDGPLIGCFLQGQIEIASHYPEAEVRRWGCQVGRPA